MNKCYNYWLSTVNITKSIKIPLHADVVSVAEVSSHDTESCQRAVTYTLSVQRCMYESTLSVQRCMYVCMYTVCAALYVCMYTVCAALYVCKYTVCAALYVSTLSVQCSSVTQAQFTEPSVVALAAEHRCSGWRSMARHQW